MMAVIVINIGITIDYAAASSVGDDAGVSFPFLQCQFFQFWRETSHCVLSQVCQ